MKPRDKFKINLCFDDGPTKTVKVPCYDVDECPWDHETEARIHIKSFDDSHHSDPKTIDIEGYFIGVTDDRKVLYSTNSSKRCWQDLPQCLDTINENLFCHTMKSSVLDKGMTSIIGSRIEEDMKSSYLHEGIQAYSEELAELQNQEQDVVLKTKD